MNDNVEAKNTRKHEILVQNEYITELGNHFVASLFLRYYLHDIQKFVMMLSAHFDMSFMSYRNKSKARDKEGVEKYIEAAVQSYEKVDEYIQSMAWIVFHPSDEERTLDVIIQRVVKSVQPLMNDLQINLKVDVKEKAKALEVPKVEFVTVITYLLFCLLNDVADTRGNWMDWNILIEAVSNNELVTLSIKYKPYRHGPQHLLKIYEQSSETESDYGLELFIFKHALDALGGKLNVDQDADNMTCIAVKIPVKAEQI